MRSFYFHDENLRCSAVSGPLPRVGDHVVCQMKPAEGYATQTPYKYYGFEVRVVPGPPDNRRPRKKMLSF